MNPSLRTSCPGMFLAGPLPAMKTRIVIPLLLVAAAPAAAQDVQSLSWLAGCWISTPGDRVVEEQWMPPRGDSMVGMSRSSRRDSLRGHELVVIRSGPSGLVYRAYPSGQASAEFPLLETAPGRVVFEDPQHDFPQRIGYRLARPDSLLAWIEGSMDGAMRRIEFPYGRASCPGG